MSGYGEFTFKIVEELGVLSTASTGWTKELNIVEWNNGVAKYDIREWDPDHYRMSKGITLKEEEMRRILDIMKKRRINTPSNKSKDTGDTPVSDTEGLALYAPEEEVSSNHAESSVSYIEAVPADGDENDGLDEAVSF